MKNHFITLNDYDGASINTICDTLITHNHSINIVLKFIHITIEAARDNVAGYISK